MADLSGITKMWRILWQAIAKLFERKLPPPPEEQVDVISGYDPTPEGQVDVMAGFDPTPEFVKALDDGVPVKDIMPTYKISELIDHLDFRSSIHETYYGHIIEGRLSPSSGYGDANFQLWAIEGYQNAIHYLQKLDK